MKTFFDRSVRDDLQQRVEKLTADSRPQWGKMSPSQMLTHCTRAMQTPLGDFTLRRSPLGLIGWMFKGMIRTESPFKQNSPTAPEFVVTDQRDYENEKARFEAAFQKLAQGPSVIKCYHHAFFGKMTSEDWGLLTYKHLNHHLLQFGI